MDQEEEEANGRTPFEPIHQVYISAFPQANNKVQVGNSDDLPELELRPLLYIPTNEETGEKETNQKLAPQLTQTAKEKVPDDESVEEKSNDFASHRSRMALLESSLFGNSGDPGEDSRSVNRTIVDGKRKNPFKIDKPDQPMLKRKLHLNEVLNKKKKM